MTIKKSKKARKPLTDEQKAAIKRLVREIREEGLIIFPIIIIREHYLPPDEDGRVTWIKTFANSLGTYVGTLAAVTAGIVTQTQKDAEFYEFTVKLSKAGSNFAEEATNYKDKATFATQGTSLGSIPTLTVPTPVPAAVVPAGIFTRIARLVDSIKADPDYTPTIGLDLDIIGAENSIDTDTLTPNLKGKIVDGRFPNLKCAKKEMEAFNLYADYRDAQGLHLIAKVTTFRRGFVDNHPLPNGVDSAVFDYQCKYVYKDQEVGQLSAKVSLTVTRTP